MSEFPSLHQFVAESRELLEEMELALLLLERSGAQPARHDAIDAVFRAAHTIKGSAGVFGLDHVVDFTHVMENVLDRAREGTLTVDKALVALLLECHDHAAASIELAVETQTPDLALERKGAQLAGRLRACLSRPALAGAADDDCWRIALHFGREALRNGIDPLSVLRYLGTLGEIVHVATSFDQLPAAADMDPQACYLAFDIAMHGATSGAALERAFDLVRDDCTVRIAPPAGMAAGMPATPAEDACRLGELLLASGSVTAGELAAALRQQAAGAAAPIGEILIGGGTPPAEVDAALIRQQRLREAKGQHPRSVRVDADKLDRLIDRIGELITAGAAASLAARRIHNLELQECAAMVTALVEDVRDSALQLRMVKIGPTLHRFERVVHDVAQERGKEIALSISGEDTELDKTVVEKIVDPLTHLVRNAIDHGIETAAERFAAGKPVRGTVRLHAYHDAGSIVIEVGDDGGGLRRDRILAKAMERGMLAHGQNVADHELADLLFEPGFSTAERVTSLSGRGVGMDVVKRNIAALRGSVQVRSDEGLGTTVVVRLPLTLAIIDGFLVAVGAASYVIPLDVIDECVEFSSTPGCDYTSLRGEVLPFLRLRTLFGTAAPLVRRESIVVVRHGGRKFGLVVDALLGEFRTVIKPLGKLFNHLECISGSSILGGGEVALILDVAALARRAVHGAPVPRTASHSPTQVQTS
ncbi:MAG TPA: chemotaxis protein CheA [Burkholderiaceae bacterium]